MKWPKKTTRGSAFDACSSLDWSLAALARGIRAVRSLFSLSLLGILALAGPINAASAEKPAVAAETERMAADDTAVISMAAYNVKADRIEDFGLRVRPAVRSSYPKTAVGGMLTRYVPIITAVLPNTAAARAGLQPGERILKSDGRSMEVGLFSMVQLKKWRETQKRKWAEVAAGKADVTWTLEVETPAKAVRTVKLVVPTPPPHWGASIWRKPEERAPDTVTEPGPLAARSREIVEHGIWCSLDERFARVLGVDFRGGISSDAASGREPPGYTWTLGHDHEGSHQIVVTQFRGRTDVLLRTRSLASGIHTYLTSPSAVLEKAWHWPPSGKSREVPLEQARVGFEHERDFWTTKVVRGSGRWPFEVAPGYDASAIFAVLAPRAAAAHAEPARTTVAEALRKLPPATEGQRALFMAAWARLGTEHDQWAYTETVRGLEDKRVRVIRVDPSKPDAERCVLLSVDGRAPTPGDVQGWRDDGGDTPKPLGDLPALAGLVDVEDVRVSNEDVVSVVFELPLRSGRDFPADKFQALFRVNKARRGFEDITVALREGFRVGGGIAKVTEAGLELRFQSFDPSLAPQPVWLKAGGGVRVLLVTFARSFESTRTDFKRVEPIGEAAAR